jgi:hypothetical protein
MPIFILIVGVLLVAAGINNKIPDLVSLIKSDFTKTGDIQPFQIWVIAIFVAGSLGYIKAFKGVANAFLVLIMVTLIIGNKGFFDKFMQALKG